MRSKKQFGPYLFTKVLGPDGFGSSVFRQAWEIIRTDVVQVVQMFFKIGKLLKELNGTHLILLPKGDHPSTAAEYRPIPCCGVIYKAIAKILSQKLQLVLSTLVNQSQATFMSGRNIIQNVLIGADLVRLYNRFNASHRALIKIDIQKAYDTANWDFLQELLRAYKFPQPFVQWLTTCVESVSYTLLMNKEPTPMFNGR